jgi:hypothetical protein
MEELGEDGCTGLEIEEGGLIEDEIGEDGKARAFAMAFAVTADLAGSGS